jgi:hypothetical protein
MRKIQILTLVSIYLAKKAWALKKTSGILAEPEPKKGKRLSGSTVD